MKITLSLFTSVLLLLLLHCNIVFARTNYHSELGLSDLTLTIATTKQTFLPLEPIPLTLTLKNNTAQPITASINMTFSERRIKIFVQRPNAAEIEIAQLSLLHGGVGGVRTVAPNEEIKRTELLALELERYFTISGNYQILAQLCRGVESNDCTARSQPLAIMLTQPLNQDLEAYNFIKASRRPDTFLAAGDEIPRLEEFIVRFQNTPYNDYVFRLIAQDHYAHKRYNEALVYFRKISRDYAFYDEVRKWIVAAQVRLREPDRNYFQHKRRDDPQP